MKHKLTTYLILLFPTLLLPALLSGQLLDDEASKCGTDLQAKSAATILELGAHWGYGYEDLLSDLNVWGSSEFVFTSSIGESTLGREIYELTITDSSSTLPDEEKHRIYIHARTHPGEVQSFWVTNEIINLLLGESELGAFLRSSCIFHVVPMYNPDGVELEYPRENANGIDIESNWGNASPEDEVVNLRSRFEDLMWEDNPIEIALNMHSAVACKRYFVYHHANGTSSEYAQLEEDFIGAVWNHFPLGMEPYYYYVSWKTGTPDRYPESWWWNNHAEWVMALTYEDMNCASAGYYDTTAYAILHGISDYLELGFPVGLGKREELSLEIEAYPNPFSDHLFIEWNPVEVLQSVHITDMAGRMVYQMTETEALDGKLAWNGIDQNGRGISAGIYLLNMIFENRIESIKLVKQ
ncbi:MAG: M14 family zinc carboxypeptidase [Bacteroidota bacterium]